MYTIAKSAALVLAVLGYAMLYQKRRLPLCFFPVTLISGITTVLYAAGLAGQLKIASYAVAALGLAALLRYFSIERLKKLLTDESILFTVFAAVWLFCITRGVMLAHNDDGTHWYRICKAMNHEHAYPTTPDIRYYEYVPGCATWIYFVTRFIQFRIENTMFVQSLINAACVASLFAASSWTKGIRAKVAVFAVITAAGVLLCSIAETTFALLVDVQVGLVTMAALIMAFELGGKREGYLPIAMVLSFLALVKNSALLFVLIVMVWAGVWHRFSAKEWIRHGLGWTALPLLLNGLYAVRSDLVYGKNAISLQGVSLERYASLFGSKSAELIGEITKNLFSAMYAGKTEVSVTMYGCILLYALLYFCLKQDRRAMKQVRAKGLLIGTLITLAVYSFALWMTYLFSMTELEGTYLFGFDRYFGTVVIIAVGVTVYAALKLSGMLGNEKRFVVSLLLVFVLFAPGTIPKRHFLGAHEYKLPNDYKSEVWRMVEIFIPQNSHYTEDSYALLWNEDDYYDGGRLKGRLENILQTWVRSVKIVNIPESEIHAGLSEETLVSLSGCDYVACLSDMTAHRELFAPYIGETELTMGLHEVQHESVN